MLPKFIYYPVLWLVLALEWLCERLGRQIIIKGHPNSGDAESIYLLRYYLFPSSWSWNLYIHRFLRSDHDVPHDHPFDFVGLVLSGGYDEYYMNHQTKEIVRGCNPPGSVLIRTASHIHKVIVRKVYEYKDRKKAPLTIIFRGPRYQGWGFHTDKGYVDFETYLGVDANEVHKEAQ